MWIGLHEPDAEQITDIAEVFGLHPLAVEDAVHAHQRPKIERYVGASGATGMATTCCSRCSRRCATSRTPRRPPPTRSSSPASSWSSSGATSWSPSGTASIPGCAALRRDLEADPEHLAQGPAAVLHAVADHVVDAYLEVAVAVEGDIDTMEAEVFAPAARSAPSRST